MSCFEWERGEIKIPAAAWSALQTALREAWSTQLRQRYELALELHAHLKEVARGKRNFNYVEAARDWAMKKNAELRRRASAEVAYDVIHVVLPMYPNKRPKPYVPKKKDFHVPASINKFADHPAMHWDGRILLDRKRRVLIWDVPENNHAVDHAWMHPMGRALEAALHRIKWTRGSGGTIVGNNEYRRSDRSEGGGSNFVSRRYGPLGEDPMLKRMRRRRDLSTHAPWVRR